MKKAFSVLLFGFIGISFVYEGHAMFSRTGVRGLTGIMEGASRLSALSQTVRPAASLAQSVLTADPASATSGMTGTLSSPSFVPKIAIPLDVFQGQPSLVSAVKEVLTSTPSAPSASPITTSMWDQIKSIPIRNFNRIKAPDLLDSGTGGGVLSKVSAEGVFSKGSFFNDTKENSVLNGLFGDRAAPVTDFLEHTKENSVLNGLFGESATATDVFHNESSFGLEELFCDDMFAGQESVLTQGPKFAKRVMLEKPKKYDLSYGQLSESLPWAKILWSADMLRLESQESGWAKAAFKVAAHHAVQYATSSLVDATIMFFCPSFVALNPASFSLSSVWNLSQAVASYAFYGSVTANPLGLSAMSALQVAHFAYQNPEYVYMAGQTMNKATTFVSSLCGNPVIGLVTGGLSPFAASVADLGSSFAGDALKGVSRGVMNFNAMLVEKPTTWLMSGASTVYSKLWAAPATEPVPAYA
ncbi:MAG: hypothetical protein ACPGUZ_02640 [Holosporaceae bacterium]